jgi:galactokinase
MTAEHAARQFAAHFGTGPDGVAFAPGRVNLIGEHVDYNDGLVLPMPIPMGTWVAWAPRRDGRIRVLAADQGSSDEFALAAPDRPQAPDWTSYVRGMAAKLQQHVPQLVGADLLITGNLPQGAGLSSSASLCIAVGRALLASVGQGAGQSASPITLARAAQAAEHDFAGVACGIMDQMAVAAGQPGHAMLLDCRTLEYSQHAIPPGWRVALIDSGIRRGLVDGEYNLRRAQCAAAARAIGVSSLREATAAQVAGLAPGSAEQSRAAHVVAEIARVRAAAAALAAGDLPAMGAVLRAGHASLRDLFAVSLPAIDALVDDANHQLGGQGGARLTGAGFGGSIVTILPAGQEARLSAALGRPLVLVN